MYVHLSVSWLVGRSVCRYFLKLKKAGSYTSPIHAPIGELVTSDTGQMRPATPKPPDRIMDNAAAAKMYRICTNVQLHRLCHNPCPLDSFEL